jgi:site-specific recombinase XerC
VEGDSVRNRIHGAGACTFRPHLSDANHDIRTVQKLLGHNDILMTMIVYVLNGSGISVRGPLGRMDEP